MVCGLPGEEIFDEDALLAPEEADPTELKQQRTASTRAALRRDRRKMRKLMKKLQARSRNFSEAEVAPDLSFRQRRAGVLPPCEANHAAGMVSCM